jgi:hypothetical protein
MNNETEVMPSQEAQVILESLTLAVSQELECKSRLGHYAVIWKNNAPLAIGKDAPRELQQLDQQ